MLTAQEFLKYEKNIDLIGTLVENWFDDNEIPQKYRMSIPLVLLYQETEMNGQKIFFYFMGTLSNYPMGNC